MIKRAKKLVVACAFVAISGLSASSYAATLISGAPVPNTAGFPEFKFDGSTPKQLQTDIGAKGNSSTSSAGGLSISTPFNINLGGDYASSVSYPGDGTTTFADVSFELQNLFADGSAIVIDLTPGGSTAYIIQQLTAGHFKLLSQDPDGFGPKAKAVILEGDITSAAITGFKNAGAASVVGTVNYTGGAVYDALVAAGGVTEAEFSWSLLNTVPVLNTSGGASPVLNSFIADGTIQFDAQIPEPATLGLLSLGAMGFLARRRTR